MRIAIFLILTFVFAGTDANAGPCDMNAWNTNRECDCNNLPAGTNNKHVFFNLGYLKSVGIGGDGRLLIRGVTENSLHEVQIIAPANLPIETEMACFQNAKELQKNSALNMAVDVVVSVASDANWGSSCQMTVQSTTSFGCELTKDHNGW